jgi:hypothetical protein
VKGKARKQNKNGRRVRKKSLKMIESRHRDGNEEANEG